MKKLFLIFILLFLSNKSYSKNININNIIDINVPNNYILKNYQDKNEMITQWVDSMFLEYGKNNISEIYIIGSKSSIKFIDECIVNMEKCFEPIYEKAVKKNIIENKKGYKFIKDEVNKLIKEYNYEGIMYAIIGAKKINESPEFLKFLKDVSNFTKSKKNEIKKEIKSYADEVNFSFDGNKANPAKLKLFEMKNDKNNNPTLLVSLDFNMVGIKWSIEMFMFVAQDIPVLIIKECYGGNCKKIESLKRTVTPNLLQKISGNTKILKTDNKDVIGKIKQLGELYKSGVITEEEFIKLKKKLIN